MSRFTRALLPHGAQFMNFHIEGDNQIIYNLKLDQAHLQRILEECISLGTLGMAVYPAHLMFNISYQLGEEFSSYVHRIDTDRRSLHKVDAWLRPILEEFDTSSNYAVSTSPPLTLPDEVSRALSILCHDMYRFVLGRDHQVQVEVRLPDILDAISILRQETRDDAGRRRLAIMQGVFESYFPSQIEGLEFVPGAGPEMVEHYRKLIEEEAFRVLAANVHDLGLLSRAGVALEKIHADIHRAVRRILRKPGFSTLFDITGRTVSISNVALPSSGDLRTLLDGEFLPPIADFSFLVARVANASSTGDTITDPADRSQFRPVIRMPATGLWDARELLDSELKSEIDQSFTLNWFRTGDVQFKLGSVKAFTSRIESGERFATVELEDGTTVELVGESVVRFNDAFEDRAQTIQNIAYQSAGSPYGDDILDQHRWIEEQFRRHKSNASP